MNEPRVVESVTNECQSLGRAHESSPARAEQLIACLEGEIAKRDEELAAFRVAVENCELFRARIAELESRYQRDVYGLNNEGDPIGGEPAGGYANDNARLRSELAAIRAQEPVAYISGCYRDVIDGKSDRTPLGAELAFVNMGWIGQIPLYAAPVSEDKAQVVVMPERWNVPRPMWKDARQPYGNPLNHADIEAAEKFNLALDEVDRLNAAPVQQVRLPDVSAMARILADRSADACNVNREDNWAIHGQDYIDDVTAMLAAPAAPAADAGLVDMYRHLQKVTPYRFKKIQDASITDGGDVMYFHADRFDSAVIADMAAHRTQGVV